MSMFDEILKEYGDYEEEWDEETLKNWEEKMADPVKGHPVDISTDKTA